VFLTRLHLVSVATAILGFLALMAFLRYSLWGRAIRAVSSSPEMARTVGIDLRRVHLLTYAVGSAISAPAGILIAMDVGVEPYRGTTFVLLASVAVIMGGIGSIPGALLGALFLALLENLGVWKIRPNGSRPSPSACSWCSSWCGHAASSAARSSPRKSDLART